MIRPWLAGQLLHYLLHHDDLVHGSSEGGREDSREGGRGGREGGREGREGGREGGRGILCQSCMRYPVYVHVHV